MFDNYFEDYEVKPGFNKEYISLWSGWLGKDRYHLLDKVTEEEWSRFNRLISTLAQDFRLGVADFSTRILHFPENIENFLDNYETSLDKNSDNFSKFVIPQLNCVITEEWDYTYILWHRNDGAVSALEPYIWNVKLQHFADN
ncbi:MAG: hypothetical protein ACK4SJ_12055 [Sphingorhabdus sp.]